MEDYNKNRDSNPEQPDQIISGRSAHSYSLLSLSVRGAYDFFMFHLREMKRKRMFRVIWWLYVSSAVFSLTTSILVLLFGDEAIIAQIAFIPVLALWLISFALSALVVVYYLLSGLFDLLRGTRRKHLLYAILFFLIFVVIGYGACMTNLILLSPVSDKLLY